MDERLRELNEELSELNGRLARANGLERRLDDLRAQYEERKARVEETARLLTKEREDVEKLERGGLRALLLSLTCLLYTSPSPRDYAASRMPSSA